MRSANDKTMLEALTRNQKFVDVGPAIADANPLHLWRLWAQRLIGMDPQLRFQGFGTFCLRADVILLVSQAQEIHDRTLALSGLRPGNGQDRLEQKALVGLLTGTNGP